MSAQHYNGMALGHMQYPPPPSQHQLPPQNSSSQQQMASTPPLHYQRMSHPQHLYPQMMPNGPPHPGFIPNTPSPPPSASSPSLQPSSSSSSTPSNNAHSQQLYDSQQQQIAASQQHFAQMAASAQMFGGGHFMPGMYPPQGYPGAPPHPYFPHHPGMMSGMPPYMQQQHPSPQQQQNQQQQQHQQQVHSPQHQTSASASSVSSPSLPVYGGPMGPPGYMPMAPYPQQYPGPPHLQQQHQQQHFDPSSQSSRSSTPNTPQQPLSMPSPSHTYSSMKPSSTPSPLITTMPSSLSGNSSAAPSRSNSFSSQSIKLPPAVWTEQEEHLFASAVSKIPEDTNDRWQRMAKIIETKTAEDIRIHYDEIAAEIDAMGLEQFVPPQQIGAASKRPKTSSAPPSRQGSFDGGGYATAMDSPRLAPPPPLAFPSSAPSPPVVAPPAAAAPVPVPQPKKTKAVAPVLPPIPTMQAPPPLQPAGTKKKAASKKSATGGPSSAEKGKKSGNDSTSSMLSPSSHSSPLLLPGNGNGLQGDMNGHAMQPPPYGAMPHFPPNGPAGGPGAVPNSLVMSAQAHLEAAARLFQQAGVPGGYPSPFMMPFPGAPGMVPPGVFPGPGPYMIPAAGPAAGGVGPGGAPSLSNGPPSGAASSPPLPNGALNYMPYHGMPPFMPPHQQFMQPSSAPSDMESPSPKMGGQRNGSSSRLSDMDGSPTPSDGSSAPASKSKSSAKQQSAGKQQQQQQPKSGAKNSSKPASAAKSTVVPAAAPIPEGAPPAARKRQRPQTAAAAASIVTPEEKLEIMAAARKQQQYQQVVPQMPYPAGMMQEQPHQHQYQQQSQDFHGGLSTPQSLMPSEYPSHSTQPSSAAMMSPHSRPLNPTSEYHPHNHHHQQQHQQHSYASSSSASSSASQFQPSPSPFGSFNYGNPSQRPDRISSPLLDPHGISSPFQSSLSDRRWPPLESFQLGDDESNSFSAPSTSNFFDDLVSDNPTPNIEDFLASFD